MKYTVDVTEIVKTVFNKLPQNQAGFVSCYVLTIGVGLLAYKLKLDHEYKIVALNVAQ